MPPRIMFIERKSGGLSGPARVGRVSFSRTGRTLYYAGRAFQPFRGYKANYFDVETGDEYWVSGCRKDGRDRLYGGRTTIDADVREEYWLDVRGMPQCIRRAVIVGGGKYGG